MIENIYEWVGFVVVWGLFLFGILNIIFWAIVHISFKESYFGYTYIKAEEYWKLNSIENRITESRRWFSGFKDLDVIWEYLLKNGDISDVRDRYAKLRGTDVYGYQKED